MEKCLEFYKINLPLEINLFKELSNSVEFEKITNGRIANHLVKIENNLVPIVRTTSKYNIPTHNFSSIHNFVINKLNQTILNENLLNIPIQHFNNALIEIYDSNYSKMKYHSDQSLDLDISSLIGLFSFYENPENLLENNTRKLIIKDKTTNEEFEIKLNHNSVILFSTETNMKFQHKIVLDNFKNTLIENKWLGITYRTSKTFIEFKNNIPFFMNGEQLILANEDQEREFFKLRGEENKSIDFKYPFLNYTINKADILLPKNTKII